MKKYKKDIIILSVLLVIAITAYLFFYMVNQKDAGYVNIYRQDRLIETYPVSKDGEYKIKTDDDFNQIVIKKGIVSMKDANCPDQLCVKQGRISKSGESIICLPHKIVVTISSKEGIKNE